MERPRAASERNDPGRGCGITPPADAVTALLKKQGKSTAPEPVGSVADKKAGSTHVRIYTPEGSGPFFLVVTRNFEGVTHEFFGMGAVVAQAREAVAPAGTRLRAAWK